MSMSEKNIYQRINEVRKKVAYVRKDAKVQGQYMAVTHDAVTAIVRTALIEEGVVIIPALISSRFVETGTVSAKSIPFMRYEGWYEVAFINVDNGEDRIVMPIEAHAIDQGDKAPGKCLSYATKYAMLKLFNLETGEDDEGRAEQKKLKHAPAKLAFDELDEDTKLMATESAADIQSMFEKGDVSGSYAHYLYVKNNLGVDGVTGMWSLLDSKCRKALKDYDAGKKGSS